MIHSISATMRSECCCNGIPSLQSATQSPHLLSDKHKVVPKQTGKHWNKWNMEEKDNTRKSKCFDSQKHHTFSLLYHMKTLTKRLPIVLRLFYFEKDGKWKYHFRCSVKQDNLIGKFSKKKQYFDMALLCFRSAIVKTFLFNFSLLKR